MVSLYQEARATLNEAHVNPHKKLGQHFLIRESVIDRILQMADLSSRDDVLEIGPGLGFMTRRLLAAVSNVWAIEIDPFLVARLSSTLAESQERLHLIHGDILKVPLETILENKKVKIVANLPYNISTAILFKILKLRRYFSLLVLMVQSEVAERMIASPGTKAYGALSVGFQVYGKILERISIPPEAFFPRPKVRSTVLKITFHPNPLVPSEDEDLLREVVRAAFGQRRKTLNNSLAALAGLGKEAVQQLLRREDIDPQRRGETLSIAEFLRLTQTVKEMRS